jgi:hypothetical protein
LLLWRLDGSTGSAQWILRLWHSLSAALANTGVHAASFPKFSGR